MPEQTTPEPPESAALPPSPWRIEPIPRRKDLRVVAPNGSILAELTGPDKAAVAAMLIAAPCTARRLARLETVVADWGLDDPVARRAVETGEELIITPAQVLALRAALEDER